MSYDPLITDSDGDGNLIDDSAGLILNDALPVEFSYVNARSQDCESVDVIWQTQTEINNRGFFIERSVGSVDRFEDMGFVCLFQEVHHIFFYKSV